MKLNQSQRWFRNENTQCRLTFGTVRVTLEMESKILNDSSVHLQSVDLKHSGEFSRKPLFLNTQHCLKQSFWSMNQYENGLAVGTAQN